MAFMGIIFDDVNSNRLYVLMGLFGVILVLNLLRDFSFRGRGWIEWMFLLDGVMVLFIEWNSRYVVNYFFHVFYIFILIELFFRVDRRTVTISGIVTVFSMVKFYQLLTQLQSFGSISETLFFLFINILIIIAGVLNNRYRIEKEDKERLYVELLEATGELEKMTRQKERARIARDIHDTLGHEMSALIMQLEIASRLMEKDTAQAETMLQDAKDGARSGLKKIREVVEALREDHLDLKADLILLIDNYRKRTGIEVIYSFNCDFSNFRERECLYRLVQEALTNTSRHSNAGKVEILLGEKDNQLIYCINDNGTIKPEVKIGYGLKGMSERIQLCGGSLEITYDKGFVLSGNLPMGGSYD
jgi:signal transduction histidine kinase